MKSAVTPFFFFLSPFHFNLSFSLLGGGKAEAGYQKSSATHSYGAGAVNISATTNVPKVQENLKYGKSELSGTSSYGAGAVGIENATNAPKPKSEGLGQVDKKVEMVYEKKAEQQDWIELINDISLTSFFAYVSELTRMHDRNIM